MITNVDHDLFLHDSDFQNGSAAGELGCWVDSVSTRVVQIGLEHSRIPDVATYLGIGGFSPSFVDFDILTDIVWYSRW